MGIILNESHCRERLFPFTHIRHTAEIRVGILTIKEKWEMLLKQPVQLSSDREAGKDDILVDACHIPTADNYQQILGASKNLTDIPNETDLRTLVYPWHISQYNDWAIRKDFELITKNRKSQSLNDSNRTINPSSIFIEEGAIIDYSIINAAAGPVYIGKNTQIMEGNMIRGPFALCEGSVLKMGSKIYSGTTIGPWCIAGGEIKNTVFLGYSNKAHDGYLGDSVIGEWCNLGAGTSNSNIKNSAGDIKYLINDEAISPGNKAGLLMGDYSRAAINTSFNTGSVVGVCCNIFGRDFPDKHTPNFTWGSSRYILDKALKDIDNWKKMKQSILSENEVILLQELYLTNQ